MKQIHLILKPIILIFLLFLLSNGRISDALNSRVSVFNDPKLFFSTKHRCHQTQTSTLLPDDNVFDTDSEEHTLSLRKHDLTRCPANANTLSDLASIDPAQSDLGTLLNITDAQQNQTNNTDQQEEFLEINVQQVDSAEKNAKRILEVQEVAEKPVERSDPPPPIATFEEWTKEKLMNKEKKPLIKDILQNGATNIVPPVDQKPLPTNIQSNNAGIGSGQESAQPTIQPFVNTQENLVQSPSIVSDQTISTPLPTTEIAKRNYASKECGAKILLTNPEAEHKNAILNDKEMDDYLRNPCEKAQNKFLIIELCETIQPNFLELANFELFSSGPREIKLSVSERYPAIEWTPVGQFIAADTREMQSFSFKSPGIYAKFVKIDLLSHYGHEHYCTITTVRVSGISMVDEYEADMEEGTVSQPVEIAPIQQISSVEANTAIENEQKIDPSNESDKLKTASEEKPFVLNKVADIVGNLGQIKEVIGKTLLGNRDNQKKESKIWPNSCTHFCPLTFDTNEKCHIKCHYFNLIDLPKRQSTVKDVKSTQKALSGRTHAQRQFLHTILKLNQCPTVIAEPKRSENDKQPNEITSTKVEPKIQPLAPQQNQQFQVPKPHTMNSLPGTVSTHKESIFMKLNKRLTALELNISLSSEYLSELSRRYVAQQDGYNKQHERDLKTLEEMVMRLGENLKSSWSQEINELRGNLKVLADEIKHIKRIAQHPPSYTRIDASSLTLIDHSDRPFEQSCYNMLPPAEDSISDSNRHHDVHSWTNEQIVAVVSLSNLSAFTLFACLYLLYKIFARRHRIQAHNLSPEEIRALVQKEMDKLRQESEQIVKVEETKIDNYTPLKRNKRSKQPKQFGIQSVASSTLSIPSTVATTSTSALDTMSSSQSLSDIDQMDRKSTAPLIMDLIDKHSNECDSLPERPVSANLPLVSLTECANSVYNSIQQQLSPPWQTVQNKRKLSDKSLKPSQNRTTIKVKVN